MKRSVTNQDVWLPIIRGMTYGLTSPYPPPMEQVNGAFTGSIDLPNNSRTRSEHLLAIRTALGSTVDIADELGLAHPDPVVRKFLEAVENRLSQELGE